MKFSVVEKPLRRHASDPPLTSLFIYAAVRLAARAVSENFLRPWRRILGWYRGRTGDTGSRKLPLRRLKFLRVWGDFPLKKILTILRSSLQFSNIISKLILVPQQLLGTADSAHTPKITKIGYQCMITELKSCSVVIRGIWVQLVYAYYTLQ